MKHLYRLIKVVGQGTREAKYVPGYFYEVDLLECGHEARSRKVQDVAEAICWFGLQFSGQPRRRRCY